MIQFTAALVRTLAGDPLTVLVLLIVERRPMSVMEIGDWTDLSDKTLARALRVLLRMGMVTENSKHVFQAAGAVEQLPLGAVALPLPIERGDAQAETLPRQASTATMEWGTVNAEEGDKFFSENEVGISDLDHACMHAGLTNTESILTTPACMDGAEVGNSDLDQALEEAGIREPALSRLRARRSLTGRVVRYHVQTAPSLGAAITRIEKNWKVPENFERDRDGPNPYLSGKYAEFIEH